MSKQYWAVGLNFDYDILAHEPDCAEWGSIDGPFDTLLKAKRCVRDWIACDRAHLSAELADVMGLTEGQIV